MKYAYYTNGWMRFVNLNPDDVEKFEDRHHVHLILWDDLKNERSKHGAETVRKGQR